MSDDSSGIVSNIKNEIEKTGFPLELRALRLFRGRECGVSSNIYYTDKDTGKGREMDLRITESYSYEADKRTYFVTHRYIAECKKSTAPWVVFTAPALYGGETSVIPHKGGLTFNWEDEIEEVVKEYHPFTNQERHGRSSFVPFNKDPSVPFDALVTVAKASIASRENQDRTVNAYKFYYPFVILDGRLFEAFLDDEGSICVQETEMITAMLHYQSDNYDTHRFLIPIVTEPALTNFHDEMKQVLDVVGRKFESEHVEPPF